MRRLAFLLLLLPAAAFADPTVSISWNACQGPIDIAAQPGQPISIYASVLGQTEGHKAYQVRVFLRPQGHVLPDAWRFDAGGCQGLARLGFDHYSSKANCPQFHGDELSLEITDYAFDANVNRWRFVYAVAYPFGIPTANPSIRYQMVRMTLDHTFSTAEPTVPGETCGNFDEPMCFYLYTAEWCDFAGLERTYRVSQDFLTVNDPYLAACNSGEVPARPETWGKIKSTYRN